MLSKCTEILFCVSVARGKHDGGKSGRPKPPHAAEEKGICKTPVRICSSEEGQLLHPCKKTLNSLGWKVHECFLRTRRGTVYKGCWCEVVQNLLG